MINSPAPAVPQSSSTSLTCCCSIVTFFKPHRTDTIVCLTPTWNTGQGAAYCGAQMCLYYFTLRIPKICPRYLKDFTLQTCSLWTLQSFSSLTCQGLLLKLFSDSSMTTGHIVQKYQIIKKQMRKISDFTVLSCLFLSCVQCPHTKLPTAEAHFYLNRLNTNTDLNTQKTEVLLCGNSLYFASPQKH